MPLKVGLKYIDIWKESIYDSAHRYDGEPLHKGQIVFYGPSYFTRWSTQYGFTPMREVLKGKSGAECVVNRGFGSSCSEHQLYYYPHMVRPLEPKVLVYSSYANAKAFGYTLEEIWELAQRVIAYAMADFPDIKIYLCGTNKSRDWTEEKAADAKQYDIWQMEFAEKTPNVFFIDTQSYEPLGRKDIYVDDGVHYNKEGYDIYAEFFREALKDELDRF